MHKIVLICGLLSTSALGCATEVDDQSTDAIGVEGEALTAADDEPFEFSAGCPEDDQLLISGRTTGVLQAFRLIALKGAAALPENCTPGYCLPDGDDDWGWNSEPYGDKLNKILRMTAKSQGGTQMSVGGTTTMIKHVCGTQLRLGATKVSLSGPAAAQLSAILKGSAAADGLNVRADDSPDNGARWTTFLID